MNKTILSTIFTLLCLQPTAQQAVNKKLFDARVTLKGLRIRAFALEKTVPVFDAKNIEKIKLSTEKIYKILSWMQNKRIPKKLGKLLFIAKATRTKEKIIAFLEEQRKKIKRNRIKLSLYFQIGKYVNYVPLLGSSAFTIYGIKNQTANNFCLKNVLLRSLTIPCSLIAGSLIKKFFQPRLELLQKFIKTEALLEEIIAEFKNQ